MHDGNLLRHLRRGELQSGGVALLARRQRAKALDLGLGGDAVDGRERRQRAAAAAEPPQSGERAAHALPRGLGHLPSALARDSEGQARTATAAAALSGPVDGGRLHAEAQGVEHPRRLGEQVVRARRLDRQQRRARALGVGAVVKLDGDGGGGPGGRGLEGGG